MTDNNLKMNKPQSAFSLREAEESDLDSVYELFAEVQAIHAEQLPHLFKQPQHDDGFKAYFSGVLRDPERSVVLACVDDFPIGYVVFSIKVRAATLFIHERRFAYIDQLAVAEKHRRSGCATSLIDYVKRAASEKGVQSIGIDHWSFNEAARACFQRNGFEQSREYMWSQLEPSR